VQLYENNNGNPVILKFDLKWIMRAKINLLF
jgi:hypothetical protein